MNANGSKLRGELFWVDRWRRSSAVLLPLEAKGLYREMLSLAWILDGRLPNDHAAIQRGIGVSADEWARCWPLIAKYWRVDGDALVNDTQLAVLGDVQATRRRSRQNGSKGGRPKTQT